MKLHLEIELRYQYFEHQIPVQRRPFRFQVSHAAGGAEAVGAARQPQRSRRRPEGPRRRRRRRRRSGPVVAAAPPRRRRPAPPHRHLPGTAIHPQSYRFRRFRGRHAEDILVDSHCIAHGRL